MNPSAPRPVYRKDYRSPDHWIDSIELAFDLGEERTRVRSRLRVRRNPAAAKTAPLVLHGEGLELCALRLDGQALDESRYEAGEAGLTVHAVPESCELETEVLIRPQDNTSLSGLYKSSGNFCTQCEAEGFRRITYFADRPDVMARYRVRIEADEERYPVLLSNGNRSDSGRGPRGRHWVQWEDPFPKPSYLFALVAGNLRCRPGTFVTASGRQVRLEIWVEPQDVECCEHALRSLQKAMRWDEETFGLEYDLDLYMIVAVGDFNMGAMENKGLNVFNSKYVLAKPDTATDDDYEAIEGVIGHEYFHNWTGNRVTCRDWFQLTLKEGLTVFRDQQFSADMTSRPVRRIACVRALRTAQFAEDAGPLAHPIRPESYIEMNNFYTATVYEKGAEVVRMYHTLLGEQGFRRGMDLYIRRHDGQAVTCDDFRAAMADANAVDLSRFGRWYEQAGTPALRVRAVHDATLATYTLTLRQSTPPVAGAPAPRPLHVPVTVGLLAPDGRELPLRLAGEPAVPGAVPTQRVLQLLEAEQSFTFVGVRERPVPSLLRGFSAPVRLDFERSPEELAFLMGRDTDLFNRWDAGQELGKRLLLELAEAHARGRRAALAPAFVEACGRILDDPALDGSLKALALTLPSEKLLGQEQAGVDVDALHDAHLQAVRELARAHRARWLETYLRCRDGGPHAIDRASIDRRRLKNRALAYLAVLAEDETTGLVMDQFHAADNLTDVQAALVMLVDLDVPQRGQALAAFHRRWHRDPLVLDKWFSVQALSSLPGTLARVQELARHPDFTLKNPNRVRALVGTFCAGNQVRFHAADGAGYRFLADQVLALDALNPQVAARMVSAFNPWRRFDAGRQAAMRAELERIAGREGLSKNVYEVVSRCLGGDPARVAAQA